MKEVTRYQCQYCKKDFKTSNRHSCKRDPAKRNCYTCQNNKGWEEDEGIYPGCDYAIAEGISALYLYEKLNYDLQCEHYKQLEEGYYVHAEESYEDYDIESML